MMIDQFSAAAEAVGATVKRFLSAEEAADYLKELSAGEVVVASDLPATLKGALASLALADVSLAEQAHLCVSAARWGVAATGSLLLDLRDTSGRGATALARVHAVFLPAANIVADLAALKDELQDLLAGPEAAYLSITTGPSRTADIERVLTIGVHGPKELHILVIDTE